MFYNLEKRKNKFLEKNFLLELDFRCSTLSNMHHVSFGDISI